MWQRTTLPRAGGMEAQDAWLMAALDYARDVHNQIEYENAERRKKKQPKKVDRGER